MNCPVDGTELRLSERQGIEIDYCPQCRGVWLDRGELDKILERSAQIANPDNRSSYRDDDDEPRQPRRDETRPQSKRRSFLEEILDFG
jgi:Zn-finger nucleic acid-binding protein